MRLKGNIESLRRLFANQAAIEAGNIETPYKILGYGCGGGFSCIKIAYMLSELGEFGLWDAFTRVKTESGAGGPFGAYFSRKPEEAAPAFLRLAKNGFVAGVWPAVWLELDMLRQELRFDEDVIRSHITDWYIIATQLVNGQSVSLNAKTVVPNIVTAVLASSAVPGMSLPQTVNGMMCTDALCGGSFKIAEALREHPDTDTVIALQGRPHPKHLPVAEKLLWPTVIRTILWWRGIQRCIRDGMAAIDDSFVTGVVAMETMRHITYARLAPTPDDTPVGALTTDVSVLRKAGEEAGRFMRQCLRQAQPARHI